MYFDEELRAYNVQYVSGYKEYDSVVKVKCLLCGNEWEINIHNLLQRIRGNRIGRNGNKKTNPYVPCPNCRDADKEYARIIANYKAEEERFIQRFTRWLKANTIENKKEYHRKCRNCGKPFTTFSNRKVYCSERCNDRARESRKRRTRRNIIESQRHDDVTLDRLFKKDKGICYLCGRPCDYSDFKKIDSYIVTGNRYPSIEHIVPISKGGTDTWDNVRLAHRICNSFKGNKITEQLPLFF